MHIFFIFLFISIHTADKILFFEIHYPIGLSLFKKILGSCFSFFFNRRQITFTIFVIISEYYKKSRDISNTFLFIKPAVPGGQQISWEKMLFNSIIPKRPYLPLMKIFPLENLVPASGKNEAMCCSNFQQCRGFCHVHLISWQGT